MRLNKRNPIHYLVFFQLLINLIFVKLFYIFFIKTESENLSITFLGQKLQGNTEVLFQKLENYNLYYATLSRKEYKYLLKKYENVSNKTILYYPNLKHFIQAFKSSVLITSHGIFFNKFLKNIFHYKSVYAGNAISGLIIQDRDLKNLYIHDSVWLFSNYELEMYKKEFKYEKNNLEITGYPRIKHLIDNQYKKTQLVKNGNFKNNIVLIAPTDDRNSKLYKSSEFFIFNDNLLTNLDNLGNKYDISFIIKPHNKTIVSKEAKQTISDKSSLVLSENIECDTDYDLLIMSDLLITDWSTIYVDYLCLDRPIIFLDTPNPNKFPNSSVIELLTSNRPKNYELLNNEIEAKLFKEIEDSSVIELKNKFYENTDHSDSLNVINNILKNINNKNLNEN